MPLYNLKSLPTRQKAQRDAQPPAAQTPCTETSSTSATSSISATLNSDRPKIQLPQHGRILSEFADELGEELIRAGIYRRGGSAFTIADSKLSIMTPETMRTWAEQHVVCFTERQTQMGPVTFHQTMSTDTAKGVLASPQFLQCLPVIDRLNPVRLPVIRDSGVVEMLPDGYDQAAQTFTLGSSVSYDETMTHDQAVEIIDGLLSEFCFASDNGRSKAVAVSAMLTVFARGLLPKMTNVPIFLTVANAEGAGKTLLGSCAIVPVHGAPKVQTFPKEEEELKKGLLTAVMEGDSYLFYDNLKGHVSSPNLEAFTTSPTWNGRVLGVSRNFAAENVTTVVLTGNGITLSPDMRRRTMMCELFMEEERAEDRKFQALLDIPSLIERRSEILSAMWALVRSWDQDGRPKPSRTHSSYPRWADVIAGIVEHAGWACPLDSPKSDGLGDADGADMGKLVGVMPDEHNLRFTGIVDLCREHGLFEALVPSEGELDPKGKSQFGILLKRYDRRLFTGPSGSTRFAVLGKGKTRAYVARTKHGNDD